MLRQTLITSGIATLLSGIALPALANPATIPIDQAFSETQKLDVSEEVDQFLDFSRTGYRIIKAFPSNPQALRALRLSAQDDKQLVLKWVPNGTADKASVAVQVMGPGGEQTITLLVKRTSKEPDNIRTAFVPQTQDRAAFVVGETEQVEPKATIEPVASPPIQTALNPKTPVRLEQNKPKVSQKVTEPIRLKPKPKVSQKLTEPSRKLAPPLFSIQAHPQAGDNSGHGIQYGS